MAGPTPTPLPPDIAAQTRAPTILALMYSFFILACLCVAGRVFSRLKKIGRLLVDDYILLLSLALETTSTGLLTAGIGYGMGRHSAVLSIPDFEHAVMCTLIGLSFAAISFTVTKIAVAILIINVLHPSPWNVRVLVGLTVGNVLIMTASVMIYYFQCGTPQALWTVGMNAKCLDPLVAYGAILGACALSALTDFYFALYPAIAIWSLDITRRKKFALCIALGFGVFAGSVAIYKCTTVGLLMDRTDYTYNTEGVIVWTSIEASCIIIAASIPLLLPLVELWFGTRLLSGRIYLRSIKTTFRRITTFRDTGKGNTTIKTCSSIPITVSHHDTLGTINAGDTRPQ